MEDSRGDYVFFEREKKTNSPKKIRRFSSSTSSTSTSHRFLPKTGMYIDFRVGHLNGSLRNRIEDYHANYVSNLSIDEFDEFIEKKFDAFLLIRLIFWPNLHIVLIFRCDT